MEPECRVLAAERQGGLLLSGLQQGIGYEQLGLGSVPTRDASVLRKNVMHCAKILLPKMFFRQFYAQWIP